MKRLCHHVGLKSLHHLVNSRIVPCLLPFIDEEGAVVLSTSRSTRGLGQILTTGQSGNGLAWLDERFIAWRDLIMKDAKSWFRATR